MPTSQYARGVAVERRAVDELEKLGYLAQRAASSKGLFDVYAIRADGILLISCKRAGDTKKAKGHHTAEKKKLRLNLDLLPKEQVQVQLWIWADTMPDHPRGGWYCKERIE